MDDKLIRSNSNPFLTGEAMSKTFRTGKGPLSLIILLLSGGVIGSALGQAAAPYLPVLKNFTTIGLNNTTVNLHFLKISFGITMSLGPVTGLGMLLGFLAYRKL
ncbi:conserved exported hypothetical protein [Desulforamulus hydrothermalis Lam5 = DSM 18033]|uniref:DUF4321 domain-containing protein n=2 Tax=Desulforamulus TaxID=2916693 RepID=K8DY55_9FIRM|nr:conserved exported hypothetical protein [Desulforamulus hydrothermalis Lam5 = DSM 18033]